MTAPIKPCPVENTMAEYGTHKFPLIAYECRNCPNRQPDAELVAVKDKYIETLKDECHRDRAIATSAIDNLAEGAVQNATMKSILSRIANRLALPIDDHAKVVRIGEIMREWKI